MNTLPILIIAAEIERRLGDWLKWLNTRSALGVFVG
jgi:hypothetical protein